MVIFFLFFFSEEMLSHELLIHGDSSAVSPPIVTTYGRWEVDIFCGVGGVNNGPKVIRGAYPSL